MRFLVGAACVVVIASGIYYLYSEWTERRAAQQRSAEIEAARVELFALAEAQPTELAKVREWCKVVIRSAPDTSLASHKRLARNCSLFGSGL